MSANYAALLFDMAKDGYCLQIGPSPCVPDAIRIKIEGYGCRIGEVLPEEMVKMSNLDNSLCVFKIIKAMYDKIKEERRNMLSEEWRAEN